MLRRRDRNCALTSSCAELHGAALDSSDRAHVRGASAGFRAPQEALADEKEPQRPMASRQGCLLA